MNSVICMCPEPQPTGKSARMLCFDKTTIEKINKKFIDMQWIDWIIFSMEIDVLT